MEAREAQAILEKSRQEKKIIYEPQENMMDSKKYGSQIQKRETASLKKTSFENLIELPPQASCITCQNVQPVYYNGEGECLVCKAEREKKEEEQQYIENIIIYISKAGVPKRLLEAQDNRNITGFITGPAGSGKSWIAAAMVRKALLEHKRVRFIPVTKLLRCLRDSFSGNNHHSSWLYDDVDDILDGTDTEIINKLLGLNLLILDDLGAEKTTDFAKQAIYEIIDGRYQAMKDTIITSNLSLQEISARFDDRIASRIAGMGKILKLTGKDRRLS